MVGKGVLLECLDSEHVKHVLIVEDDADSQKVMEELIQNKGIEITTANTGNAAKEAIKSTPFDAIILDLNLPDISGFDLLKTLEKEEDIELPPVIIYTGRELTEEEDYELKRYAASIIVKGKEKVNLTFESVQETMFDDEKKVNAADNLSAPDKKKTKK